MTGSEAVPSANDRRADMNTIGGLRRLLEECQVEHAKLWDDLENADKQLRNQARSFNTVRAERDLTRLERDAAAHRMMCPTCESLKGAGPCKRGRQLREAVEGAKVRHNSLWEVERVGAETFSLERKSNLGQHSQRDTMAQFVRTELQRERRMRERGERERGPGGRRSSYA